MKQPRLKIASYVAAKSLEMKDPKDISNELAAYLLVEGRVAELDSILRDVEDIWAEQGLIQVVASSAHEIGVDQNEIIEKTVREYFPAAKQIKISQVVDPSIIGGIRLNMANRQIDLSLEAKLNKFRQLTEARKV
jgi:F0F1-type ATP synthase delta subunit